MLRAKAKCEMMPVVFNNPDRDDNGAPAMEEVLVDRPEAKDAPEGRMRTFSEQRGPIENYQTA